MAPTALKRDAACDLAEFLVKTNYRDLAPEDVDITKKCILDTLGTLAAGSPEPPFEQLVSYVKREGGKRESTVLVYGGKVPARNAVLVNASMARALDLDEVHEETTLHACATVVPTAFAMSERQRNGDGKSLITAVALGFEIMARLRLACRVLPTVRGRAATYIFGTFGAAAVSTKLLGFDTDMTVSALGNAFCQATGDTACYKDGTLSQRVHQGVSASAGVLAALLSQNGVEGSRNVFEGPGGYYTVYEQNEYDPEPLRVNLGKEFWIKSTSFKPYPNSKGIHLPMEAALAAVLRDDIKPGEIEKIVIRYPAWMEGGVNAVGYYNPERTDPGGAVDAHFSIPWAIGVIVARRKAEVQDFSEEGVKKIRQAVVPVARKVVGRADASLEKIPGTSLGPCIAEITTSDGKVHTARVDYCTGSPRRPFTWNQIAARFKDLASCAAREIPAENVDRVIDLVQNLEKAEDATKIVRLLSAK